MKNKVEVIIQARMGSTRLPGKVMMHLAGKPVLWHVIERVRQARNVDQIIVATTTKEEDNILCESCKQWGVPYYRGEEKDVLHRFYETVQQYPADCIVRITSDCPLIDPEVIDQVIVYYYENPCEYASNTGDMRTYPRGLDCEVFSTEILARANEEAAEPYEREHVTPFMYWKQDHVLQVYDRGEYSNKRWTLDTMEDYQFLTAVYDGLYHGSPDFYMREICNYLEEHPEIEKLNAQVQQKPTK